MRLRVHLGSGFRKVFQQLHLDSINCGWSSHSGTGALTFDWHSLEPSSAREGPLIWCFAIILIRQRYDSFFRPSDWANRATSTEWKKWGVQLHIYMIGILCYEWSGNVAQSHSCDSSRSFRWCIRARRQPNFLQSTAPLSTVGFQILLLSGSLPPPRSFAP